MLWLVGCGDSESPGLASSDVAPSTVESADSNGSAGSPDNVSDGQTEGGERRIEDSDAAGVFALEYSQLLNDYIFEGLLGRGAQLAKLEEFVGYEDPATLSTTVGAAHACFLDLIAARRDLLAGDALAYETTIELAGMNEVRDGLWIATTGASTTIRDRPDVFDYRQYVIYMNPNGVFASRNADSEFGDGDGCDGVQTYERTELGEELLEEAQNAENS